MELAEIRKEIDCVDRQIRSLFEARMKLAEEVACVKAKTEDAIYKPDREAKIIQNQTREIDPSILREYTALIKRMMEVSRKYQYGRTIELRDCFPYKYHKCAPALHKAAMVKEELYACQEFSRDDVLTKDTFEEVGEAILKGEADAGIGVLEEVGIGVSDELHNLLVRNDFHILRCKIREDGGIRRKVVTFIKDLTVLPDHNRIRIMFQCPNRYGSLASILSMISDYGVNLTEIHSRPFYNKESWNYLFFAELEAHADDFETRAMIYQLSEETEGLKILGSYFCEGDF